MGLYEGIKDVAKVMQQADNIKLYQQLLDLSAQALDLQAQVTRLSNENIELKKARDSESQIVRHRELYLTLDSDNEDPSIIYCTHCWDSERKLIQTRANNGTFQCPHCSTCGAYDKTEFARYTEQNSPVRIPRNRRQW